MVVIFLIKKNQLNVITILSLNNLINIMINFYLYHKKFHHTVSFTHSSIPLNSATHS